MMMETKQDINWARVCDTCQSAPSTVYCRADSAYLCTGCDAHIHAANRVASLHERVWVCDACERAPSAFLCKADAASLCTSCDADIHSANPLATRHHRVPVLPIPGCLFGHPATDPGGTLVRHGVEVFDAEDGFLTHEGDDLHNNIDEEDEEEAASWLLTNPVKNETNQINGFLFGGEVIEYLDLVDYNPGAENNQFGDQFGQHECSVPQNSYGGDSIVPVHGREAKGQLFQQPFQLDLEFDPSKAASSSYNGSISQNVSSLDVSIVSDSTLSDISISNSRPTKGAMDFFSGTSIQMPTQLSPIDREARVLRYRQKKKARKFEKTIRYASRKAYAETRPRIKGRFARRTDVEVEVGQMFSTTLMAETEYGIVPSF